MRQSVSFLPIQPRSAQLPYQVGSTIKECHDMNRLYAQLHVTRHWPQ